MATLINKITDQIVHVELVHEFLAAVEDAEHWVEHKVEEAIEAIFQTVEQPVAPEGSQLEAGTAIDAPVALDQPVETTVELAVALPAEAAAIAADPAAPGAAEALNTAAGV